MKYRKISLIALSAALLLSGCNTDKAVTTTADTAAVTEEVTTEATTTAASTTTTSTTTAAPEPEKTYGIIDEKRLALYGVLDRIGEPFSVY